MYRSPAKILEVVELPHPISRLGSQDLYVLIVFIPPAQQHQLAQTNKLFYKLKRKTYSLKPTTIVLVATGVIMHNKTLNLVRVYCRRK